MARVLCFQCSECEQELPGDGPASVCRACGRPLLARYDLEPLSRLTPSSWESRRRDLWRYHEVLPLEIGQEPLTLGEGLTPLLELPRLAQALGYQRLLAKNEAANPTGSFKDRGMAVAIHRVVSRGGGTVWLPSAGNAASSASAYARRAGIHAVVTMPATTPESNREECRLLGSRCEFVEGSLREAAAWLGSHGQPDWVNLATLREPFRLEGKKTLGYELYEQGAGRLPDCIVYPTGGGTGLIGMWKAFAELSEAGLVSRKPRMIAVQAEGCAPIVEAHHGGRDSALPVENPVTVAAGLRVPQALGDRLMLRVLRESGGDAVAVSDPELFRAARLLAETEGILCSLEAAATIAALPVLREEGRIDPHSEVVLFLTASGLKSLDAYARSWPPATGNG